MITNLVAVVYKPRENEENIRLEIRGKERIYYELDDDGLRYENIGQIGKRYAIVSLENNEKDTLRYQKHDSTKICIYSRTIKAPTGKKKRNYGFKVQINDDAPFELKYKKEGSEVTSRERPGWNYTQSGIWHIYLPIQNKGIKMKILPMKGNPVVYVRLTSNLINREGAYGDIIKTVNHQERIDIVTKDKKRKFYMLNGTNQHQFEIRGPATVRAFSRLNVDNESITNDYYLFVREDGIDLGTYYFKTEKSTESSVLDSREPVSKWRSLWLNIPEGKHYYTFSLPNMEINQNKTVFIRLKEWKE